MSHNFSEPNMMSLCCLFCQINTKKILKIIRLLSQKTFEKLVAVILYDLRVLESFFFCTANCFSFMLPHTLKNSPSSTQRAIQRKGGSTCLRSELKYTLRSGSRKNIKIGKGGKKGISASPVAAEHLTTQKSVNRANRLRVCSPISLQHCNQSNPATPAARLNSPSITFRWRPSLQSTTVETVLVQGGVGGLLNQCFPVILHYAAV